MSRKYLEIENRKQRITPSMACIICDALSYMVDMYAEYYTIDDDEEEKIDDIKTAREYYNTLSIMKEYTRDEFFDHSVRYSRIQERQREMLLSIYESRS